MCSENMDDSNCTGFEVLPENQVCQGTNLLTNVTPEKDCTSCIDSDRVTSPILQSSFTNSNINSKFCSSTPTSVHHSRPNCISEEKSTDFVLNVLDRLCSPISRKITPETKRCTLPEKSGSNAGIKYTLLSPLKQDNVTECNVNNCANDNNITDFFKEHDISENTLQVLCQATSDIVNKSSNKQTAETMSKNVSSNKVSCDKGKPFSFPSNEVSLGKLSKDQVLTKSSSSYNIGKTSLASGTIIDDNYSVIYHSMLSSNRNTQISLNDLFKTVKELEEANVPIIINPEICNKNVIVNSSTKESELTKTLGSESTSFKRFVEVDSQAHFISVNDSVSITDTQFCEVAETAEIIYHNSSQSVPFDCSKNNKNNSICHVPSFTSSRCTSTEINTESSVPVIPQIRKSSFSSSCQTSKYCINDSKLRSNDCTYAKYVELNCFNSTDVAEEPSMVKDNSLIVTRKIINNVNEIERWSTDDENRVNVTKDLLQTMQPLDNNNQTTLKPSEQKILGTDFKQTALVNKDSTQMVKQICNNKSEKQKPTNLNGFYKASGKTVCITEDSLNIAIQLNGNGYTSKFEDLYKLGCNSSATTNFELKGFSTASGKLVNVTEESLKTAKQFFDNESESTKPYEFKGFCTAGGKAVNVSEDSLKISRQLFNDNNETIKTPDRFNRYSTADDEKESRTKVSLKFGGEPSYNERVTTNSELKGFSTASSKAVNISIESLKTARRFFDNDCEFTKPEFKGFCTAGGRTVNISDDSLKIAKQFFNNDNETTKSLEEFPVGKNSSRTKVLPKAGRQLDCNSSATNNFELKGFSTASGKTVNVSEESLKTAKQFLDNECESTDTCEFKGFCTAGGKAVNVSEDSLKIARQLFDSNNEITKPLEEFKGYFTADGKDNCRTKVLPKTRRELGCNSSATNNFELKGFSTASGKLVNVSEESLKTAKQFLDNECESTDTCEFKGFCTAGGKAVNVSEDSLKIARKLFDNNNETIKAPDRFNRYSTADANNCRTEMSFKFGRKPSYNEGVTMNSELKVFSTTNSKAVNVSEDSLKTERHFFDIDCEFKKPKFKGFCTAGGRIVDVSDDSLKIAKQFFDNDNETTKPLEEFKGYSTADNKNNFRTKVFPMTGRELGCNSSATKNSEMKGFSTANGKAVNVSEESLKTAKQFIDIECESTKPYEFKGFCTAAGKAVSVSEDSLKIARQLFDDNNETIKLSVMSNIYSAADDEKECRIEISPKFLGGLSYNNSVTTNSELKGFSTASGKAVNVSDESLKTAKQFFHTECESTKPELKGFSTTGGKNINVDEDSLNIARQFFDYDDGTVVYHNNSELTKLSNIKECFLVSSGKVRHIAEDCSKVTKLLFDNENILTKLPKVKECCNTFSEVICKSDLSMNIEKQFFDNDIQTKKMVEFKGLCKGASETVQVSKESLQETRELLKNEDETSINPELKDYITADNKAIHVTGDSLNITRNLFHNGIEMIKYPSKGEFCPDVGKIVDISDKPQKPTKHLFENDVESKKLPTTVFNDDSLITDPSTSKVFQIGCQFESSKESERFFKPYEIKGTPSVGLCHTTLQNKSTTKHSSDCCFNYFGSKQDFGKHLSYCSIQENMCKRMKIEDLDIVPNKRRKLFHDYDQHDNTTVNHSNRQSLCTSYSLMSVISEDDLSLLNQTSTVFKNRLNSSFSRNFRDEGVNQCYGTELSPSIAREVSESTAALIADDQSNSSFSLKPFVSSPAIIFDRETNLPSISCYEKESNVNDKQLSPVLDNFSHFKAHHSLKNNQTKCKLEHTNINKNKNNTPQTKSCSFKPPYVTSTPNEISIKQEKVKRLLTDSNYYTPFSKRFKTDKNIIENIKVDKLSGLTIIEARKKAREAQELYIQDNLKTSSSCKGLLSLQKQSTNCVSLEYLAREHPLKLYVCEELIQLGVKSSVIGVTRKNAVYFKFDAQDYFSIETALNNVDGIPLGDGALLILDDEGKAGVEEFTRAFMASPAVDSTLISSEWVRNHFLWIVWKMAAMEKLFPKLLCNQYFTPNNVMLQLKYRYDREIDRCQRPALRKIFEKDESPAKPMVLFVADIIKGTAGECEQRVELELSDGWYSVIASIDHEMEIMVKRRIVRVGTKLLISGADISGINDGCHPLEKPPDVRLIVSTNSTRRARWYARLGWSSIIRPPTRLRGVLGRGGSVPALTAVVARTYPLLFFERLQEGKSVIRSERAEQIAADNYQLKRQQCAETILSQLQLDLEQSRSSHKQPASCSYIKTVKSNTELYSILKEVDDISIYQDILSKEQISVIEELRRDEASRTQLQLQKKLVKLLDHKMPSRVIRRMIKVRLADSEKCFDHSALLTVWNPSDDVLDLLIEGNSLVFHNLSASGYSRYGELLLTGGKQTRYSQEKHCVVLRNATPIQQLQNPDIKPPFSEIDVVGVVVLISNSSIGKNSNQVYIADSDFNFLGISFNSNIKDTGYGNIINLGSFIAVSNLHWRSNLVSWSLPTAFATETSTFSQHPRQSHLINAIKELKAQSNDLDLDSYLDSCREKIKSLILQRNSGGLSSATKTTSIAPNNRGLNLVSSSNLKELSVITTSDANISAEDVDLLRRPDSKSGILFDGNVDNNCDTPINKKIILLERFGEPPSISPLPISTPTRVKRHFQPPKRNIDEKS